VPVLVYIARDESLDQVFSPTQTYLNRHLHQS